MKDVLPIWLRDFEPWIFGISSFVLTWFAFYLTWRILAARLRELNQRTGNRWGDIVPVLRGPAHFVGFLLSVRAATYFLPEEARYHPALVNSMKISLIFLGAYIAQRLLALLLHSQQLYQTHLNIAQQGLINRILSLVIFLLAGLAALDSTGISITPLLASLGVGSVAVALALQDTLGNMFAGFYILVDKPFVVGDYIRIDPQTEGTITKLSWRSTRILQPSNNTIVIPNSKISSATLINFNLPSTECSFTLDLGVSYDSDLNKVERLTIETALKVMKEQSSLVVPSFSPLVRFSAFADSAVNLTLILRITSIEHASLVRHELIKALKTAYDSAGIEIPFPQRVVQIDHRADIDTSPTKKA